MKSNILVWFLLSLLFVKCDNNDVETPMIEPTARYKIVFDTNWTASSHPTDYPSNAHFSWMVGVTHKTEDIMFKLGGIASDGVEQMAETGLTEIISEELDVKIKNNDALEFAIGNVIDGDGLDEIMLNASVEQSHFSFVSMIAPSPDWFVANVNVLLIQNDDWIKTLTLDIVLYDSGTDSGLEFTSANIDTQPREPIYLIVNPPLGNGTAVNPPLGTITITKQ